VRSYCQHSIKPEFAATCEPLNPSDAFVLEDADNDATILRLPFGRLIVPDSMALSHGTRGQHSGQGNVSLLNQKIGHLIGAVFAELLVHSHAADGGGVTFHLDHVAVDGFGFAPDQALFSRTRRDFSHGCIRVEDPKALAVWVLRNNPGWTNELVAAAFTAGKEQQVNLTRTIPVLIVYASAVVEEDGQVFFLEDIYGHDKALAKLEAQA
jgi:hypothetical protein